VPPREKTLTLPREISTASALTVRELSHTFFSKINRDVLIFFSHLFLAFIKMQPATESGLGECSQIRASFSPRYGTATLRTLV
jgi:hypothetical protein